MGEKETVVDEIPEAEGVHGGLRGEEADRGGGWRLEKVYMSPKTYLEMMEGDGSLLKDGDGYVWNVPLPVKYQKIGSEMVVDWGGLPLYIDEVAPEWAVVYEEE